MVWDMFPSFLELFKASLGHKNVNFNYFSIIHGKKQISCSGATSSVYGQSCFSRHNFVSNLFKNCKTKATKLKDKDKDKDKDKVEVKDKDKDEAPLSNYLG